MSAVVNKQELATWLGVSLPTLGRWMLRYGGDFPILERGSNGRDYQFDAAAVSAFLRAKQEEQAASKAERDESLTQLRLPFDLPGAEPPPKATSAKEEIEAWKLRKLQREEAEAAAQLVAVAHLGPLVMASFGRLSRDVHAFLRQLGRELNWPEAFTREQEKRLAEMQRAAVAALRKELGEADAAD